MESQTESLHSWLGRLPGNSHQSAVFIDRERLKKLLVKRLRFGSYALIGTDLWEPQMKKGRHIALT